MLRIKKELPSFDTYSQKLGYDPADSLFFDIETTGFQAASTVLYLIGAVYSEGRRWMLAQWLAAPGEERVLLAEFLDFASPFGTLIHFNGTTFDLPYLQEKLRLHGLPDFPGAKASLDLYRLFRPLKEALGLENGKQETFQAFLGASRSDPLNGRELIPLYHRYAASPCGELARLLLLHNEEDLRGMTALLSLCSYLALFEGEVTVSSCRLEKEAAVLSFDLSLALPQKIAWEFAPGTLLEAEHRQGTLQVFPFRGELYHFFPNWRDYYYLPLEDQAIHKSVASFVDRQHRVAAKPSTCYTKHSGIFLAQPAELLYPVFVKAWKNRTLYFELTENLLAQPALLTPYVRALLCGALGRSSRKTA